MLENKTLLKEREHIAYLDSLIVPLLIERLKRARKISLLKHNENIPIHDPKQEKRILQWIRSEYPKMSADVVIGLCSIYRAIFQVMRTIQEEGRGHA